MIRIGTKQALEPFKSQQGVYENLKAQPAFRAGFCSEAMQTIVFL
jgi:hypothetical protein